MYSSCAYYMRIQSGVYVAPLFFVKEIKQKSLTFLSGTENNSLKNSANFKRSLPMYFSFFHVRVRCVHLMGSLDSFPFFVFPGSASDGETFDIITRIKSDV